jgi:hypothetical protein
VKAFTGRENARDEETPRLRKEIAGPREAEGCPASLEILKKQWPSSQYEIPGSGVPVLVYEMNV